MQFMILRKAGQDTEAGVLPGAEPLQAMAEYKRQLGFTPAQRMRAGQLEAGMRQQLARARGA